MNAPAENIQAHVTGANSHDYKEFKLFGFSFSRDEYFAHIKWTGKNGKSMSHSADIANYLRPLMRDVA